LSFFAGYQCDIEVWWETHCVANKQAPQLQPEVPGQGGSDGDKAREKKVDDGEGGKTREKKVDDADCNKLSGSTGTLPFSEASQPRKITMWGA